MSKKQEIRNNRIRAEIRKRNELGMKIKDAITIVADMFYLSSERIRDIWYFKEKVPKNKKQLQMILSIGILFLMAGRMI